MKPSPVSRPRLLAVLRSSATSVGGTPITGNSNQASEGGIDALCNNSTWRHPATEGHLARSMLRTGSNALCSALASRGGDHVDILQGYWPSPWPVECGGPRRQKVVSVPGPALGPSETIASTIRQIDGWPVMTILRDPGEVYLLVGGGLHDAELPPVHRPDEATCGWVERIPTLDRSRMVVVAWAAVLGRRTLYPPVVGRSE